MEAIFVFVLLDLSNTMEAVLIVLFKTVKFVMQPMFVINVSMVILFLIKYVFHVINLIVFYVKLPIIAQLVQQDSQPIMESVLHVMI